MSKKSPSVFITICLLSLAILHETSFAQNSPQPLPTARVSRIVDDAGRPRLQFEKLDYRFSRAIHDQDGDGWCDLWCALFRFKENEEKNYFTDQDGDGLSDFEEMVLMQDPSLPDPELNPGLSGTSLVEESHVGAIDFGNDEWAILISTPHPLNSGPPPPGDQPDRQLETTLDHAENHLLFTLRPGNWSRDLSTGA